jgi:hypothetical protein
MSFRRPFIAALVAVLLFGVYLVDRQDRVAREQERLRVGRIMAFDYMEATRLVIEGENGRFVLERQSEDEWRIVEPVQLRADEARIRTIIDNVHASKKANPFIAGNLAEYGLDPPAARIVVEGKNPNTGEPATATVLIGSDTPRLSRIYAMVEGDDKIFTTLDTLRNQTRVTLLELRDRRLVHFDPTAVQSLELRNQSGLFRMRREGTGWVMQRGDIPANETMIETALVLLSEARAIRILEGDERPDVETSGLHDPFAIMAKVETAEGTREIQIGRRIGDTDMLYVRGDSLGEAVGEVRSRDVASFLLSEREWVTPRFLWAKPSEIESIEIRSADSTTILVRDEEGVWRFEDQPDSPVHQARMEQLLTNLASLAGQQLRKDYATAEEARTLFGVREGTYELAAVTADGRTEGYQVGQTEARELSTYLLRIQDSSVWTIDMTTLHLHRWLRGDLRDNRIHYGYGKDVAKVIFSTETGAIELVREAAVWRLHLPTGRKQVIPDRLVEQFLYASEELSRSAELFSSTKPPMEYRVRFEDAKGEALHEMSIHRAPEAESIVFVGVGDVLYEVITESFVRFQKASDELLLTGQQLAEEQQ